jgi:hypothetical protein
VQEIVCNRAYSSMKTIVPSIATKAGFKFLAFLK